MSREFIRTEQLSPVAGDQVVYQQDVQFQPAPRITADANGVYLTGHHIAATRDDMNRLMACMEAAFSDHLVLKMMTERRVRDDAHTIARSLNIVALAHGKSPSEHGGSSV